MLRNYSSHFGWAFKKSGGVSWARAVIDGPFSKRELEDFGEGLGLPNLVYRIWSGCPPISPPGDHGLTEVSLGRKLVRFWP